MRITRILKAREGAVTVDWVVLLGALTLAGLLFMQATMVTMSDQAGTARDELQNPHFASEWAPVPAGN